MKKRPVHLEVSDHAALRWLEREHGLDIAAVKAAVAGLALSGAELGAVGICVGKVRLVLRNTTGGQEGDVTVVTAMPRDATFSGAEHE